MWATVIEILFTKVRNISNITDITNILYAGVDSTGKLEASSQYGNKARADSIALVVMDEKNRRMTILSINRDTMTDIRRYTMNGNDKGLYTTHIGYAYSYGDGGKVSCESLCEAVSLLLGDIPVKRYVVTNQDSMPYINELAGGITLYSAKQRSSGEISGDGRGCTGYPG